MRIAAENLSFRGEAVGIRTPLTDFPRNDKDDKDPDIATPIDIYYCEET